MNKNIPLVAGITILFLGVVVTPMTLGLDVETSEEQPDTERYLYPEYYNCYSVDEIDGYVEYQDTDVSIDYKSVKSSKLIDESPIDGPPMDSPWPMYCHDVQHTGRSPYSTINIDELLKWRYPIDSWHCGSPIIDKDGIIYIGGRDFFAIYPNGTLWWKYDTGKIVAPPAIDENGVIYVGTIWGMPNYLYAIHSNSGTLIWKCSSGDIWSGPTIGDDGVIYYSDGHHNPDKGFIYAVYPNGTQKWKFKTNHVIFSSPAISRDGTVVYCGSHDKYLYAIYSNNGTLKWKFKTGGWVHGSPAIGEDGTVYIGSDDDYLYALNPNNGSMIWRCGVGGGIWGSPAIDEHGHLYVGGWNGKFHGIYPNGTKKWTYETGGNIWFTSPAYSADGNIYFGNEDGCSIIALDRDGNLKWRKKIATDWICSAPAIAEDGSVYIATADDLYHGNIEGYLYAFGELDSNAPSAPIINGPTKCYPRSWTYKYTFVATSPVGKKLYYYIDWGDSEYTNWFGPFKSGDKVTVKHKWDSYPAWTSVINAQAMDTSGLLGYWGSLIVTMPRNKPFNFNLLSWFFERFPLLEKLLTLIRVI